MAQRKKRTSKRVTQKDVATAADVSVMTVSNVIRGKTQYVSEETRAHVKSVIKRLNYRPHLSAQRLRGLKEGSIGFLVVDKDPAFLSDPLIGQLASGLSNQLSSNDYVLDIQGTEPAHFADAAILNKIGNDALCVILSGSQEVRRQQISRLTQLAQPVVIFQETLSDMFDDVAVVRQDDEAGGRMVAQHVLTKNVQSIVFLRPKQIWSSVEQKEIGVRAALDAPDLMVDFSVLCAPSEFFEDVFFAVKEYLAESIPDAIIAINDAMAIAAIRACEDEGLKVPNDIRVSGFSGYEHWRVMLPSLTTVVSPAYEMGRFAGELVLNRLETGKFEKQNFVFPVSFRAGNSA